MDTDKEEASSEFSEIDNEEHNEADVLCSDEDFSDAKLHPDLPMTCEVQQDTLHGMCIPLFLMLHLFKHLLAN